MASRASEALPCSASRHRHCHWDRRPAPRHVQSPVAVASALSALSVGCRNGGVRRGPQSAPSPVHEAPSPRVCGRGRQKLGLLGRVLRRRWRASRSRAVAVRPARARPGWSSEVAQAARGEEHARWSASVATIRRRHVVRARLRSRGASVPWCQDLALVRDAGDRVRAAGPHGRAVPGGCGRARMRLTQELAGCRPGGGVREPASDCSKRCSRTLEHAAVPAGLLRFIMDLHWADLSSRGLFRVPFPQPWWCSRSCLVGYGADRQPDEAGHLAWLAEFQRGPGAWPGSISEPFGRDELASACWPVAGRPTTVGRAGRARCMSRSGGNPFPCRGAPGRPRTGRSGPEHGAERGAGTDGRARRRHSWPASVGGRGRDPGSSRAAGGGRRSARRRAARRGT